MHRLADFSADVPSGLVWRRVPEKDLTANRNGEAYPEGTQLHNCRPLAEALDLQTSFEEDEWRSFNVKSLRADHYVKTPSTSHFYRPARRVVLHDEIAPVSQRLHHFLRHSYVAMSLQHEADNKQVTRKLKPRVQPLSKIAGAEKANSAGAEILFQWATWIEPPPACMVPPPALLTRAAPCLAGCGATSRAWCATT